MRNRKLLGTVAIFGALSFVAVGCSSDKASDTAAETAAAETTVAADTAASQSLIVPAGLTHAAPKLA